MRDALALFVYLFHMAMLCFGCFFFCPNTRASCVEVKQDQTELNNYLEAISSFLEIKGEAIKSILPEKKLDMYTRIFVYRKKYLGNITSDTTVIQCRKRLRSLYDTFYKGRCSLLSAVKENKIREAAMFLILGEDETNEIERKKLEKDKDTSLFEAVLKKRTEMVKLILYFGANVNVMDLKGWTPLHYAASLDDLKTLEVLLHYGADPNKKSPGSNEDPLDIAYGRLNNCINALLKYTKKFNDQQVKRANKIPLTSLPTSHWPSKCSSLQVIKLDKKKKHSSFYDPLNASLNKEKKNKNSDRYLFKDEKKYASRRQRKRRKSRDLSRSLEKKKRKKKRYEAIAMGRVMDDSSMKMVLIFGIVLIGSVSLYRFLTRNLD